MPPPPLKVSLSTTIDLVDRFSVSLESPYYEATQSDGPSALPLISASATALKAQTTKLSLLAINDPFTPSALSTVLSAVNDSVLPSLVTGILLLPPERFTSALSNEILLLSKTALRDFKVLVEAVLERSRSNKNVNEDEKKTITEAVGRIWDGCDNLIALANGGIAGLIVKKAQQFQALVQDALNELKDWDPEDEDEDDFFGNQESEDDDEDEDGDSSEKNDTDEIEAHREYCLKVFQRVPQCIHVIVKSRLQKAFPSDPNKKQIQSLDRLISHLKATSEAVDEAAGALYERDISSVNTHVAKVKTATTDAVDCVLDPWTDSGGGEGSETKEDIYIKRARDWIQAAGS